MNMRGKSHFPFIIANDGPLSILGSCQQLKGADPSFCRCPEGFCRSSSHIKVNDKRGPPKLTKSGSHIDSIRSFAHATFLVAHDDNMGCPCVHMCSSIVWAGPLIFFL